jgi:hypothetical protein
MPANEATQGICEKRKGLCLAKAVGCDEIHALLALTQTVLPTHFLSTQDFSIMSLVQSTSAGGFRANGSAASSVTSSAVTTVAFRRSTGAQPMTASPDARRSESIEERPRQDVALMNFHHALATDESMASAFLKAAIGMVFPSCVPRPAPLPNWDIKAIQCLKTVQEHIDLTMQLDTAEGRVSDGLRELARNNPTRQALTQLAHRQHTVEDLRQLNIRPTRNLFHVLQGFIFRVRTMAEHQDLASKALKVRDLLYAIGLDDVDGPSRSAAIDELGLTPDQVEAHTNWYSENGLGIQAMALVHAIKVAEYLRYPESPARERAIDQESYARRFRLGPKTIETLFVDPGAIKVQLPHNASIQQIVKELQRRADDQFPDPPKPPKDAPAAS